LKNINYEKMNNKQLEAVLKHYTKGKISFGKAAELADVSVWKFPGEMEDKKIPIRYDLDDIKSGIDRIVNKDN
jgi:predicted HTH domain antitoxin